MLVVRPWEEPAKAAQGLAKFPCPTRLVAIWNLEFGFLRTRVEHAVEDLGLDDALDRSSAMALQNAHHSIVRIGHAITARDTTGNEVANCLRGAGEAPRGGRPTAHRRRGARRPHRTVRVALVVSATRPRRFPTFERERKPSLQTCLSQDTTRETVLYRLRPSGFMDIFSLFFCQRTPSQAALCGGGRVRTRRGQRDVPQLGGAGRRGGVVLGAGGGRASPAHANARVSVFKTRREFR